jgi:ABC-type oligopeptide transport system substrate-binding subunit
MVQYYCDQLGAGITVKDGVNGWYNKDKAVEYLNKAVEELGDSVTYPIQIDVVYYSASETITNECKAYKQVIEEALGDKVVVNLLETTVDTDYYAAGYRSPKGETADYDMFFGSGWGPDYGDPSTYLDTSQGMGAGYMTKVIGLF